MYARGCCSSKPADKVVLSHPSIHPPTHSSIPPTSMHKIGRSVSEAPSGWAPKPKLDSPLPSLVVFTRRALLWLHRPPVQMT